MKEIIRIEMATDTDVYELTFGNILKVEKLTGYGGWVVLSGGDEIDWVDSKPKSIKSFKKYIVDDDLIISGYGIQSGRKYWQLPGVIKSKIMKQAFNAI